MGWSTIGCAGSCQPKIKKTEDCLPNVARDFMGSLPSSTAHAHCETNKCICNWCADTDGKHKSGKTCATNQNVNHTNAAVGKPLTVMGRVIRCRNIDEI